MSTESSMYAKVREFVVRHWHAAEAMTKHDSGPEARGRGLSLNFSGIRVEPDVYGVVVKNSVHLPILGEGKLYMGGHIGTQAFGQALTYRNLGMLSFLFFPEVEFENSAATMFSAMCSQAGIGLLKVPAGKEPIDPEQHVVVELAGGTPTAVVSALEETLATIKGIGVAHLNDIYPTSLRDLLGLFTEGRLTHRELRKSFQKEWPRFTVVLTQRPYDPMVTKKVRQTGAGVRDEYLEKFIAGALALGLLGLTADGFELSEFGTHLQRATAAGEHYTAELSPYLQRLFSAALMREFEHPILDMLNVLHAARMPVSSRMYCLSPSCGENTYHFHRWRKNDRVRCPSCDGTKLHRGIWDLLPEASPGRARMTYSLLKFSVAAGLFASARPHAWADEFPELKLTRPSGQNNGWNYYWLGPSLSR